MIRRSSFGAILFLFLAEVSGFGQTRIIGTVQLDTGEAPPAAKVVVHRLVAPRPRAAGRAFAPGVAAKPVKEADIRPFNANIKIHQGIRTFSASDVPDGRYQVCVIPDDPSYLSNCEFAPASDAFYALSNGALHRPIALKLRRGTMVEIAVSDPFGVLAAEPGSGFHFQPSFIANGHVKVAKLTSRLGTVSTYAAAIPLDSTASLFVATRLIVLGQDGQPHREAGSNRHRYPGRLAGRARQPYGKAPGHRSTPSEDQVVCKEKVPELASSGTFSFRIDASGPSVPSLAPPRRAR